MQNYSLFSKHLQSKKQAPSIFQIYTFIFIHIGGRLSYITYELTRYTKIFNNDDETHENTDVDKEKNEKTRGRYGDLVM